MGPIIALIVRFFAAAVIRQLLWLAFSYLIYWIFSNEELLRWGLARINWSLEWAELPTIPPIWSSYGCALNAWLPIAEAWVCVKIYLSLSVTITVMKLAKWAGGKVTGGGSGGGA